LDSIKGTLEHIVFKNEENGYTVAKLLEKGKAFSVTVVGNMIGVREGEQLTCHGSWRVDKKFGKQFSVQRFDIEIPTTTRGIEKYLSSGAVSGVGPTLAKRIVDTFGEKTLEVFDLSIEKLRAVEGIGKKKLAIIQKDWESQKDMRQVMIFLQNHGISPAYAKRVYLKYGQQSINRVQENPYRLATDITGIGFKKADAVAQKIGIDKDSPMRVDAGLEYVLHEQTRNGHTCLPYDYLVRVAAELLGVAYEAVADSVQELAKNHRIIIKTKLDKQQQPQSFVWLEIYYNHEKDITIEIDRLLQFEDPLQQTDWDGSLEKVTAQQGITLAIQQEEAVLKSLDSKIHIITGGPGTGKSTITKVVLQMCLEEQAEVVLAAPTGRASKRLAEITTQEAFTLHTLLVYDFMTGGFRKNHYDPLTCNVLIVDEASMIDTFLMRSLLQALPDNCKLILVGDIDQLPSVGAGNILSDLIDSGRVPVTRLTEIFRQAVNSTITTNAHKINQGIFPNVQIEKDSDFFFITERAPERIIQNIYGLIDKRLPKAYQLHKLKDIQLLCPMNKGKIGSTELNRILQLKLNPNKKDEETGVGHRKFVEGDKVIQTRNNYDKGVYNGDIGYIKKIASVDKQLFVEFDGKYIEYDFASLIDLELAYAVSVHKYQGSESPCIIMPIHESYNRLLYRNLVYTGVTRGKKLVIMIGTKEALNQAIKNNKANQRYTGLVDLLTQEQEGGLPEIKLVPALGSEGYEEWVADNFDN
jgi:exodeoxyribonuclease V alpha subunit